MHGMFKCKLNAEFAGLKLYKTVRFRQKINASRNENPVQSYMVDLLLQWTLKTKTSLETQ